MVSLSKKLRHRIARWRFAPRVQIERGFRLKRLGTNYGGWYFEDREELKGATIVSAGLGEDASFDIEFAREYGAKVIIVDPTPRAISHFRALSARLGQPATTRYVDGGNQPVEAYPLDAILPGQLVLVDRALWTETTTLKFYLPADPKHVSHSIINFQNDYSSKSPSIDVISITLEELIKCRNITDIPMIKMDIEGAEILVIKSMIKSGIKPNQMLLEFDELIVPSPRSRDNFLECDKLLRDNGYLCKYFDGISNFLYTL